MIEIVYRQSKGIDRYILLLRPLTKNEELTGSFGNNCFAIIW